MSAVGFTKGAATRAERSPGARPLRVRHVSVAVYGALDNRPYRRPGRVEAKGMRAARKAARRAYADSLKTQRRAVRRNVLALERAIRVM